VYGAVDIGSNTVHLLVARWTGTALQALDDRSDPLQLGHDLELRGTIRPARVRAAARTIRQYVERARSYGAVDVLLLGTQAVRAADNRAEIVAAIEAATGLPVTVVEPEQEARLAVVGAALTRTWPAPYLVADVGGASTQLVLVDGATPLGFCSVPIGSARLAARLRHDPPTWRELARLQTRVAEAVLPAASDLLGQRERPAGLIVAGGAAPRTARLIYRSPPPHLVTLAQLHAALARPLAAGRGRRERARRQAGADPDDPGGRVDPGRANAGCAVAGVHGEPVRDPRGRHPGRRSTG
jgi:exopolyphosphatase/pppGpp-phosphohydrolase